MPWFCFMYIFSISCLCTYILINIKHICMKIKIIIISKLIRLYFLRICPGIRQYNSQQWCSKGSKQVIVGTNSSLPQAVFPPQNPPSPSPLSKSYTILIPGTFPPHQWLTSWFGFVVLQITCKVSSSVLNFCQIIEFVPYSRGSTTNCLL